MYCFAKFCRTCILNNTTLINLYSCDDNQISFLDMLIAVHPKLINLDDNLPKLICLTCRNQLRQAYQFQEKCNKSLKTFKYYLTQMQPINQNLHTSKSINKSSEDFEELSYNEKTSRQLLFIIKEREKHFSRNVSDNLNFIGSPRFKPELESNFPNTFMEESISLDSTVRLQLSEDSDCKSESIQSSQNISSDISDLSSISSHASVVSDIVNDLKMELEFVEEGISSDSDTNNLLNSIIKSENSVLEDCSVNDCELKSFSNNCIVEINTKDLDKSIISANGCTNLELNHFQGENVKIEGGSLEHIQNNNLETIKYETINNIKDTKNVDLNLINNNNNLNNTESQLSDTNISIHKDSNNLSTNNNCSINVCIKTEENLQEFDENGTNNENNIQFESTDKTNIIIQDSSNTCIKNEENCQEIDKNITNKDINKQLENTNIDNSNDILNSSSNTCIKTEENRQEISENLKINTDVEYKIEIDENPIPDLTESESNFIKKELYVLDFSPKRNHLILNSSTPVSLDQNYPKLEQNNTCETSTEETYVPFISPLKNSPEQKLIDDSDIDIKEHPLLKSNLDFCDDNFEDDFNSTLETIDSIHSETTQVENNIDTNPNINLDICNENITVVESVDDKENDSKQEPIIDESQINSNETITNSEIPENQNEDNFACEFCGKLCQSENGLNMHVYDKHIDKQQKCRICGQTFARKASLMKHLKMHANKQYQGNHFDFNQRNFRQNEQWYPHKNNNYYYEGEHRNYNNGYKYWRGKYMPHKCFVCHRRFEHYPEFRIHIATHNRRYCPY